MELVNTAQKIKNKNSCRHMSVLKSIIAQNIIFSCTMTFFVEVSIPLYASLALAGYTFTIKFLQKCVLFTT